MLKPMKMLLSLIIILLSLWIVKYNWNRRFLYQCGRQLNGPPALPIVGNGLFFWCKQEGRIEEQPNQTSKL